MLTAMAQHSARDCDHDQSESEQSVPPTSSLMLRPLGEALKKPRKAAFLERVKGIEPSYAAWEAAVLPLNYTRVDPGFYGVFAPGEAVHTRG